MGTRLAQTTPRIWLPCPACGLKKVTVQGAPTGVQVSIDEVKPTRKKCSRCGWSEEIESG